MTTDPAVFDGGCTCRAVRYRMTSRPLFVHCCHCHWCQRESGAAFALNALIEADRVELLQGEVEMIATPSNSGNGQKVARCPKCHVALWSNYAGAGDALRFVRVGTLDDPDRVPPDIHIFTASKQSWVVLPTTTPAVAEYYKASAHWPTESLARLTALKSGRPVRPAESKGEEMSDLKTYQGSCFCGAVQLTVTGEPAAMGYCHCESCRRWSAGPVNAFTLWKPEAVQITRGADNIGTYNKTPHSARKWCKTCGGHLLTEHPGLGLTDVYAAVIPDFPYQPAVHVHYQETRLRIRDGLPKLQDVPKEMGGSGVSLAE